MLKQNKLKLIISSTVILLPSVLGFVTGAKSIIFIPFVLLAFHLLCLFITSKDPKSVNQSKKAFSMIFWIIPSLSVWVCSITYALAYVEDFDPTSYTVYLVALMFIVIGNYMPKIKQNHTLGIKLKWTLLSESNWNRTHRFAGKIWVIGGVVIALCALLPISVQPFVMVPAIFAVALVPMLYSYMLYRRQKKDGTLDISEAVVTCFPKWMKPVSIVLIVAVLTGVSVLMFTGNIKVHYSDSSVTFVSTYWDDIEIKYSEIESIEYRETNDDGSRIYGFGSARLQLGEYKNEEFGNYIRCCYTNCDAVIIVKTEKEIYVVNRIDSAVTKAVYEDILARM